MSSNYLLTGGTGFLGKYIYNFLISTGNKVTLLGKSDANDIVYNLAKDIPFLQQNFHVVIHAAGKAHIQAYNETIAKDFFDVNLEGTKNLCSAIDKCDKKPEAFIFISTVAVYGVDTGEDIVETHPLKGNTPYAKSKIEAEYFLHDWSKKNNIRLSILRLPLIAGKNPPGNLGAMIKGMKSGRYFNIDGGKAKRSMVLAEDVAAYIPTISKFFGTFNLTDGYHPSYAEISALIADQLHRSAPKNIPIWLAQCLAFAGNILKNKAPINSLKLRAMTSSLTFNDSLARNSFGWKPRKVLDFFTI